MLSILVVVVLILIGLVGAFFSIATFIAAETTAKLGVITALVSVAAFIYNNNRQKAREITARQFADKREAYQGFFDLLFKIFSAQRQGEELSPEQLADHFEVTVKKLMVWGSADTVNQYNKFLRNSLANDPNNNTATFQNVEDLLRAFRRDLGHDDSKLESLALTKLILKADEHEKLDKG